MGNLCATPKVIESQRMLVNDRGSLYHGDIEMNGKGRGDSVVHEMEMTSRPRVHRGRGANEAANRTSGWGVAQRSQTLKDCSDEDLLAELEHRNIRLHEKVTETLVHQRYKFGRPLGQGSSAMVHEARHKRTGKDVAIKVIKRNDDMNDEESMATELEILKSVHHRYILNCLELFETPQCIWVVMEIIRGGELLDLLIEGGVYTERDAARAMKQAFLAISYLHSQGIVHRDLKLQNMLLTEKERTSDLKICDFGLSAQIDRSKLDWGDKDAVKAYHGLSDRWGTPQYFAPEMLWKAYGPQVDLWALGVVLFQLLVGRLPFNASSNPELFKQIERSPETLRRLFSYSEWQNVSDLAKDLVTKLLHPDPKQRVNADEALAHEWIALRGGAGAGGDLRATQHLLKQQVAQKRLTALWHVLDIMNALEGPGATPRLHPALAKRASDASYSNIHRQASSGKGRARLASQTDRVEELQNLFNLFDTDGNGSIDQYEIQALFKKLGFEVNPQRLQEVMSKVDQDANGTLEFAEFCEFLRLAKTAEGLGGSGGLGIGSAVEDSLNSLADEEGFISNDGLVGYLSAVASATGQPLTESEIQDVLALSQDAGSGGSIRPSQVRDAMMLGASERHTQAEQRRATRSGHGDSLSVA